MEWRLKISGFNLPGVSLCQMVSEVLELGEIERFKFKDTWEATLI